MFNMQKFGLFDETEEQELRKCIMFYAAVASEKVPKEINLEGIGKISAQKIKTDLIPVLLSGDYFHRGIIDRSCFSERELLQTG